MNTLPDAYLNQGQTKEAERLVIQLLSINEKMLGAYHPKVLHIVSLLCGFYSKLHQTDMAEQMYERALQGSEKVLGSEHVWTLRVVMKMGDFYHEMGRNNETEDVLEVTQGPGETVRPGAY